ncbi:MAG TPA: CCA tRNA nucleotidyltransferase, partial [Mycobacteriales bacterium]|nr:CCA tRNA nucleotidyltransferase [Mycobacteriales bacterium]
MSTSPADLIPVPAAADRLGRSFAAAGHELHLVGGTVRDALLGRPSDDLDFATDARPDAVLALIGPLADAIWTTGIDFGTVGAQVDGVRCEITTYRADRYDRVSRNPIVQYGETLADDLRRRDFTMNAMAVSVPDRVFTDPYGGLRDLAAGVLRTPAGAAESFADDPLRMLRAARFVAQLGVTPAADVVAAMTDMAEQLDRITVERVQVELSKLICGRQPRLGLG